ncbi:hypothetical protein BGX24_008692 [Mortierella sp. AD032]|nr:hypothetical protein BGX24_008692 [Mortierella sp. AD032]
MGDKYPQFKAHEFKIGLSQTSGDIETYHICREANTVSLVLQEWRYGLDGHDAILMLNNKFREKWKCREDNRSIATLYNDLKKVTPKLEKGKKSSIFGKDEPEYPKDLIHQAERVPSPPPIEETGFPLPVRLINSISKLWEEWEVEEPTGPNHP